MDNDLREQLARYLQQRKEIQLAYLFGSHAKGRATMRSDLDLAVLLTTPKSGLVQFRYQTALAHAIEQHLNRHGFPRRTADVVVLNHAEPFLSHQIIKYGHLLFERAPRMNRDFKVQTMTRYFDTKPLRDFFFRRAMMK